MHNFSLFAGVLASASVVFVSTALPASAISLGSSFVTGYNAGIDSQFNIDITDSGSGRVTFTFTNVGSVASSITDIYFGKVGTINNYFAIPGTIADSGNTVAFDGQAAPPQPPSGQFGWTAAYTSDSNSGNPGIVANGVNNYTGTGVREFVSFTFNTLNGNTATSIYNAFFGANPDLAIAFHVQGIGPTSQSAWYGTNTVKAADIPEPFTMLGTGVAVGFSALYQREKSKQKRKAEAKA